MIRAYLVDDERLARSRLRTLLADYPKIQVVAEADCVGSALAAVQWHQPDVVFLDIQMPGQSGFDFFSVSTRSTVPSRDPLGSARLGTLNSRSSSATITAIAPSIRSIT